MQAFKESYEQTKMLDKQDANKMLEIAAEFMGIDKNQKLDIKAVEAASIKHGGKVIIGQNSLYRYSKTVLDIIKFPFQLLIGLGRSLINPFRRLMGKPPLKSKNEKEFYSEQFVKTVAKWSKQANEKANIAGAKTPKEKNDALDEAIGRYGSNKNFFSTKVMDYSADKLSNFMKLTGFVTVPFLAIDAYNVTLGETRSKDTAKIQSKQRAVQDSARQGVSLWFVKSINNIFKALSNSSLLGNAATVGIQTFAYESITRMLVGQPLLPTTHKKMIEVEQKRAKSNNWFTKIISGKIKMSDNKQNQVPAETNQVKDSYGLNTQPVINSFNFGNSRVADMYKQFATNLY